MLGYPILDVNWCIIKENKGRRANDIFVCATALVRQEDTLDSGIFTTPEYFLCVDFMLSIYFCYVLNYDAFRT